MKAYENIMRFDLNLDIFFLERETRENKCVFQKKKDYRSADLFDYTYSHVLASN